MERNVNNLRREVNNVLTWKEVTREGITAWDRLNNI